MRKSIIFSPYVEPFLRLAIVLILLFLFLSGSITAQDRIVTLEGNEIPVLILQVNEDAVQYKPFDLQDGPAYSMYLRDIEKIIYQDGRVEWIAAPPSPTAPSMPDPFDTEAVPPAPPVSEPPVAPDQPPVQVEPPPEAKAMETPPEMSKKPPIGDEGRKAFMFGVTLGVNAATGIYDYKEGPNPPEMSLIVAPAGGIHIDWAISRSFGLQSNLWYQGKGDRIDMGAWAEKIEIPYSEYVADFRIEAEGHVKTYVGYLEWSVMPTFYLSGFHLGAGAYVAMGLHGKETSDYKINYYLDGELDDVDEFKGDRDIEFTDLISAGDDQDVRYFNRFDYGFLGYMGFPAETFTVGLLGSFGREQWEPDNSLFTNEKPLSETYHLTGTLFITYFF